MSVVATSHERISSEKRKLSQKSMTDWILYKDQWGMKIQAMEGSKSWFVKGITFIKPKKKKRQVSSVTQWHLDPFIHPCSYPELLYWLLWMTENQKYTLFAKVGLIMSFYHSDRNHKPDFVCSHCRGVNHTG